MKTICLGILIHLFQILPTVALADELPTFCETFLSEKTNARFNAGVRIRWEPTDFDRLPMFSHLSQIQNWKARFKRNFSGRLDIKIEEFFKDVAEEMEIPGYFEIRIVSAGIEERPSKEFHQTTLQFAWLWVAAVEPISNQPIRILGTVNAPIYVNATPVEPRLYSGTPTRSRKYRKNPTFDFGAGLTPRRFFGRWFPDLGLVLKSQKIAIDKALASHVVRKRYDTSAPTWRVSSIQEMTWKQGNGHASGWALDMVLIHDGNTNYPSRGESKGTLLLSRPALQKPYQVQFFPH